MKKRLLSLALVSLFILVAFSSVAAATDDFTIYDGVLREYNGSGGAVVIPSNVNEIGDGAFASCFELTSVTIPNSVTRIGDFAFSYCSSLKNITIPNSVKGIGKWAFANCTDLMSISISNSVTEIGEMAFYYCSGLTSIIIPNSVTAIGECAFLDCTRLTSIKADASNKNYSSVDGVLYNKDKTILVAYPTGREGTFTIPSGVLRIENNAFNRCVNLTSITIANSVTAIGECVFEGCTRLTSIEVDSSNNIYSSVNGVLYSKDRTVLVTYPPGRNGAYTIPDNVLCIGDYAFSKCSGLMSITIPNSVMEIGDYAFSGCSSLTSIILPNSVTEIGEWAFDACFGLTSISIPNGVTVLRKAVFRQCYGLTIVSIPNNITEIGEGAFSVCSGLTSVSIPNSVSVIGTYAFVHCIKLANVAIPRSVTSIGEGAFTNCTELTSINIDSANEFYTSIDGVLFSKDRTTLVAYPSGRKGAYTIPSSTTKIMNEAFSFCPGLTSVVIPNGFTSIGFGIFSNCIGLKKIEIPDSVTKIEDFAFNYCTSLESITIPSSVTEIGYTAFQGCNTSLIIYGVKGSCAETFANILSIKFVSLSPEFALDTASEWAKTGITEAIAKGFVPYEIQNLYTNVITRQEFCRLSVRFTEYALDKDIDDILAERGLSRKLNAFEDTTDPYILAAFALGITKGTKAPTNTTPGLFTPNGSFTRQEAATMLMRVCGVIGADTSNPPASDFQDINEADNWAHDGINYVRANGIMDGTSTTTPTFNPKGTYTRQESIVTLYRINLTY